MEESAPLIESLVGPGLIVCYIFFALALLTSVGMPVLHAIKHPQGLIKALIGIVGLVVLFGISYGISGSEVTVKSASLGITQEGSRMIGAGMILFYIVLIVSALLAIYSLIKDIISD